MNTSLRLLAVTIIGSLSIACVSVSGQGTAYTYQGRLNDHGGPVNGVYDFRYELHNDASTNGLLGSPMNDPGVVVSNGLFTSRLDFGPGIFTGDARWLQVFVRSNNAAVFSVLVPRQRIDAAPYAIFAGQAADLKSGISPVFTGTATFSPSSGPPFQVTSSTKVADLNADVLDGLDSTAFVRKAGDTMTGNLSIANPATLSFGSNVRQMLNLWDVQYGIGVQANTLYYRSHNNFAWYREGVHSDTAFDPGAGGTVLMTLGANGNLAVASSGGVAVQGDAGTFVGGVGVRGLSAAPLAVGVFGWATNGALTTGVYGRADGTNSIGVSGLANFATGLSYGVNGQSASAGGIGVYGANGGGAAAYVPAGVYGESTGSSGNGVVGVANNGGSAYGVWGRSASGYAGVFGGAVLLNAYSSSGAKPNLDIADLSSSGFARLRMRTGSNPYWDLAVGTQPLVDATNSLRFFNSGPGNGDVMTLSPEGDLHVRVLTIEGGADVAEPFKMSKEGLPKGSVVVIDPDNPGRLKLSVAAYDTRVAGVISGAGGVNPGLSLNQRGLMEGDQLVALSGRVYVQADTSNGPIKPGDLLTTSDLPGHAMKVTDPARSQGAILGKAMTGLREDQGLVLTLVTLQ